MVTEVGNCDNTTMEAMISETAKKTGQNGETRNGVCRGCHGEAGRTHQAQPIMTGRVHAKQKREMGSETSNGHARYRRMTGKVLARKPSFAEPEGLDGGRSLCCVSGRDARDGSYATPQRDRNYNQPRSSCGWLGSFGAVHAKVDPLDTELMPVVV